MIISEREKNELLNSLYIEKKTKEKLAIPNTVLEILSIVSTTIALLKYFNPEIDILGEEFWLIISLTIAVIRFLAPSIFFRKPLSNDYSVPNFVYFLYISLVPILFISWMMVVEFNLQMKIIDNPQRTIDGYRLLSTSHPNASTSSYEYAKKLQQKYPKGMTTKEREKEKKPYKKSAKSSLAIASALTACSIGIIAYMVFSYYLLRSIIK
ncbi:hypothetical protein [Jeotgalibaca porci]|uniref:hypothetical protein n=1 Tax=Jeotgalibaca porci TaxID=1868793 RepID=UPI0035A0DCD5